MNKIRAKQLLLERLEKVKLRTYARLMDLVLEGNSEHFELKDRETIFEVEIQFFWDSGKPGNIRVAGAINEVGGWSAYRPLTKDFIIRPDGSSIE